MATLKLYTSHRLETLADKLAGILAQPLASALQQETVMVQSQGMARWLKLELARQLGVCANHAFPFPKIFCAQVLQTNARISGGAPSLEREVMLWQILRLLPELLTQPEFRPLRDYLSDPADVRKRFQLSAQIANLFDQYLAFRPDLILAWDEGKLGLAGTPPSEHEPWQAILWRRLVEGRSGQHWAAQWKEFNGRAAGNDFALTGLPERISIFGISALPPSYLQLFCALGRRIDLHLFLLQPSKEYWGSIVSVRESDKILKTLKRGDAAAQELHLETGNHLLASMGHLGRDFLNLILESGDWEDHSAFENEPQGGLLQNIQADIFHLRDRGREDCPKQLVGAGDTSLRVHCCHGPLREVEILYDHLLDWFGRDPQLTPRDVLVMTPDIETYAPLIHAVFDSPEEEARRIPFSVADRGGRSASQLVDAFLNLLSLSSTRLEATSVLRILETAAVRQKFGLSEADLDTIRVWVRKTNIRWGRDAKYREELGLPALPENTWKQGIDRLLLGYALAGRGEQMFGNLLPYDDIEGGSAEVLGRFAEYLRRLFETVSALQQRHTMADWEVLFRGILEQFFQAEERRVPEILLIHSTLQDLVSQAATAGSTDPVDLAVILESLNALLEEDRSGSGFLSGGVTFCALKPMRSIPFKVICLIGMNDGAFPRTDRHLSFDLMAQKPRLGDRSLRADDRYLFLETLLSAREKLHVSYVGQSIRDNSESPPSVLVSELLDYVAQGYEIPGEDVLKDLVVTRHRLQAFSKAYFNGSDGRLFSYSAENCRASHCGQAARVLPPSFLDQTLTEPEAERRTVDPMSLAEFLCHPAKWTLTRRLGLWLEDRQEKLEEVEPFAVDALAGYSIKQELVELGLRGVNLNEGLKLMKAAGRLPLGEAGAIHYRELRTSVERFLEQLRPHLGDGYLEPIQVDFALGEFRVTGEIRRLTARGALHFRCANVKAKDLLRLWVQHLVLNTVRPGGESNAARLVASDKVFKFPPLGNAQTILAKLLELYWAGLSKPLKLYPQTSRAYAEAELKQQSGDSNRDPLEVARPKWEGTVTPKIDGEREDAYFDLCFRHADPLDDEFRDTARAVFEPILTNSEEIQS